MAGPPPGFLSRFDVIHVVAQHRAAVVQRDQRTGRRPGLVPPRKRATGQKTRRQRLRERNAKIYGGLFVFVVALVRGLSLLKDTRRKTADGYSKRRPKLSWKAYAESLLRDTLEAADCASRIYSRNCEEALEKQTPPSAPAPLF